MNAYVYCEMDGASANVGNCLIFIDVFALSGRFRSGVSCRYTRCARPARRAARPRSRTSPPNSGPPFPELLGSRSAAHRWKIIQRRLVSRLSRPPHHVARPPQGRTRCAAVILAIISPLTLNCFRSSNWRACAERPGFNRRGLAGSGVRLTWPQGVESTWQELRPT
jgi:hypothetical protein